LEPSSALDQEIEGYSRSVAGGFRLAIIRITL
jgi:hypothetical protein